MHPIVTETRHKPPVLLRVENLGVAFPGADGIPVEVVRGVSFEVARGEMVALVGESGCGKSMTALAVLDLLPGQGMHSRGTVEVAGVAGATNLDPAGRGRLRGRHIGLVPQEPLGAFNPVRTIGSQLRETLEAVAGQSRSAARREARALLEQVAMPDPAQRLSSYPHELSGGQRQRALLALALAAKPRVLFADEPTTALDVTLQAQILALLDDLRRDLGLAIVLISHDLAVVASTCERVMVMYAGEVVESAPAAALFQRPAHPYTQALLAARPQLGSASLPIGIPGSVPDLAELSGAERDVGCLFAPRCRHVEDACRQATPPWYDDGEGHGNRCARHEQAVGGGAP